jgi:hypothetical protein
MKETFQNMKKSHLRIQFVELSALQKATKATIITNFFNEHAQYFKVSFIDFINDELVCYSRQKK